MFLSLVVVAFLARAGSARADLESKDDSLARESQTGLGISLRSVTLDGSLFFFIADYGGSVDVDLLELKSAKKSSLGIRAGVEWLETGSVGGNSSSYRDYNLLARYTIAGELLRLDFFLGYTSRNSGRPGFSSRENLAKYGGELRWKIGPGVFGLLAKANGTSTQDMVGIGLYVGWDQ